MVQDTEIQLQENVKLVIVFVPLVLALHQANAHLVIYSDIS